MPSRGTPTPLSNDRALLARSCPPGALLASAGKPPSTRLLSCEGMCRAAMRTAATPGGNRSMAASTRRSRFWAAVATECTVDGVEERSRMRADTKTRSCMDVCCA